MFYTALVYAMLRDSHGHQGQHFIAGFTAFLIRIKIACSTTHHDFYFVPGLRTKYFFPVMCEYQLFSLKKKVAGVTTKRKCLRARRKFKWKKRGKERKKGRIELALTQLARRAQPRITAVSGLLCGTCSALAMFAQQEPVLHGRWHAAPWAGAEELVPRWPSRDSDLPTSKEEDSCRSQAGIPKLFSTQQLSSIW